MEVRDTPLQGVLILAPRRFGDARGWFSETWNRDTLRRHGIDLDFVQDNHSLSTAAGTIRGLHCQAPPAAQAKLVRCLQGAILDVAVDARPASPTFGRWFGAGLSSDNGLQLLIPEGFLHGFVTRTDRAEVAYKCSAPYASGTERAVRFDDPDLAIDWGIAPERAILSDKDRAAPLWREWQNPF